MVQLNVPIGLALLVLGCLRLRETRPAWQPLDLPGAALIGAGRTLASLTPRRRPPGARRKRIATCKSDRSRPRMPCSVAPRTHQPGQTVTILT